MFSNSVFEKVKDIYGIISQGEEILQFKMDLHVLSWYFSITKNISGKGAYTLRRPNLSIKLNVYVLV